MSEKLRKKDYVVKGVPHADAVAFVREHHYAKGASNTAIYLHGMYRLSDGELVGVALWLAPTQRCALTVNADNWRGVLSLSRLAVRPDVPANGASYLIGRSIALIRRDGRFTDLVTFADEARDHTGGIYRATNWRYVGQTVRIPRWEDADGRQIAQKATRNRSAAEMRERGYTMVGRYRKHKFVMNLNRKRAA